jgi:predicted MFS family arabinose efflux permease
VGIESKASPRTPKTRRPRIHYGWWVVVASGAAVLLAAGIRSAPGVFLLPIENDLALDRSTVSLAVSLGLLVYGLSAPFSGKLIDNIGSRAVATIGLIVIAGSMLLSALSQNAMQLTLFFGILSGVGTGLLGSVLGATIANRWFVRNRGLVIGIFGATTSAGQLLFLPLLATMAAGIGWRQTSVWLAAVAALLVIPIAIFVRNDPSDLGLPPYGGTTPVDPPKPEPRVMRRAVRSIDFWLLVGTFGICGLTSNGIVGTHFITHAVEHGFTTTVAAGTLAVMGAFNFVGTLASGWLTDRYDPRRLLLVYYGFRGVSLFLVPVIHDQMGLMAFAVLFGLDYIATVPPTVALAADSFGRQNVGTVYGWIFASHQLGAAVAAWAGGFIRQETGSYGPAFLVAGSMAVLAGMAALAIRASRGRGLGEPAI